MSRGPRLVHRAAGLLQEGPVHTLELAREVLGLDGHAGAASAAVFTLLGDDPRFRVDGEGHWSLAPGGSHLGVALDRLAYAVVDVETTGGRPGNGHRITEIAVVEVRDGVLAREFRTLVNPGRAIPLGIQSLTGITPEMVAAAPTFEHVAPRVAQHLEGCVFVAHNVGFDWRFVAAELTRSGLEPPEAARLCTVRMARRLVPRLRRRNLDELSRHFGVGIQNRHRAYDDALATARILIRLLDEAGRRGIHDLDSLQAFLRRPRSRSSREPDLFDGSGDGRRGRRSGTGRRGASRPGPATGAPVPPSTSSRRSHEP